MTELQTLLGDKQQILKYKKVGKLVALGSGFYCTPSAEDIEARILVVAQYYPRAVISGMTALYLHGLMLPSDGRISADIERSTNLKNNLIQFRRVTKSKFIGITELKLCDKTVKVYDPERSLAELYRLDLDPVEISGCWKAYIQKDRIKVKKLKEYGEALGIDLFDKYSQARVHEEYLPKTKEEKVQIQNMEPSQKLDYKKLVLEAAIAVYGEKGSFGMTTEEVANLAGVKPAVVLQQFKNKKILAQAVHDALEHKFLASFAGEVFSVEMPPREFAKMLTESALKMAESDPVSFRIQKWSIAEDTKYAQHTVQILVSAIIKNLRAKIIEAVPQIHPDEAEARATLLAASYDHYLWTYWYYINHLHVSTPRQNFLENYKRAIVENLMNMCFAPATWEL